MNAVARQSRKLTVEEYLELENQAETKSEFLNGEMIAMAGAAPSPNFIKDNLIIELGKQLKGSGCRTSSGDQRVSIPSRGLYAYPDIVVFCGKMEMDAKDPICMVNPTEIIEVLSKGTANYDRDTKFRYYQQIPSLKEYILIKQDEPVCERFVRQEDDAWLLTYFVGLSGHLQFHSIPAKVAMSEIYADVVFEN